MPPSLSPSPPSSGLGVNPEQISLMGDSCPPPIPPQVLAYTLNPIWSDPSLQNDVPLMSGPGHNNIDDHDLVRDDVNELMRKLVTGDFPLIRSNYRHRTEARCQDHQFQPDPHDNTTHLSPSPGTVDYALYFKTYGEPIGPQHIVLVIEAKPGELTAEQVRAVDRQIRARANAASDNGVNKHFYLIGWVGCWFRPYYWCQGDGQIPDGAHARATVPTSA